jgi:chromate transporter
LAVVMEAVLRIAKRVLKSRVLVAAAILAFLGIFLGNVPFPVIVGTAAVCGTIGARFMPHAFTVLARDDAKDGPAQGHQRTRTLWGNLAIGTGGLVLWGAPVFLVLSILGAEHVLMSEGVFFSKLAVVTFGGAYAVLAYMAQQAVEVYGWLTLGEMVDGLGLAESTPGPLILVTQFVGFLGAYRNAAPFDPLTAGLLGSAMTLWVTFVPCFIWIFLGAPYIERLRYNRYLSAALSTVTAAVVGVIANLAVWFGVHVLFEEVTTLSVYGLTLLNPTLASVNVPALALAIVACIALFRFHLNVVLLLLTCGGLGALVSGMTA